MTHRKRLAAPDSWPLERKNRVYTVGSQAGPHGGDAVPLVVFVRDVLGYAATAKEVRYALHSDEILINGDAVDDHRRPIGTFDIVAFPSRDEHYRVFPGEGGRLSLTPVEEDAAGDKLARVDDKTDVAGGATQLDLHDGATLRLDDAGQYEPKDSVVVALDDGEIVHHFPFEEGKAVTAVDGQHSGEVGAIAAYTVTEGSNPNIVEVERGDGSTFETIDDYVFVIGEDLESLEEQEAGEA